MSDFSNMRLSAVDTDRSKIEERIRSYGGKLEKLQKALNAARPLMLRPFHQLPRMRTGGGVRRGVDPLAAKPK
jgi:hypothetical protein